jgi:hypothetical protein
MLMRFPVASPKTALSTTRDRIISVVNSIRQWKQAADAKYRYVFQTINVQTFGDLVTVRARLTGKFPGSPVELDHIFKLSGDKIASLEIRP